MKAFHTLFLAIVIISCKPNKNNTIPQITKDSSKNNNKLKQIDSQENTNFLSDTLKRFEVDGYPITNEMLECDNKIGIREIKNKNIISLDKVWFTNDSLNQTIVFEMYTDGFRVAIFHFNNNDIPDALIKKIELHKTYGDLASSTQKLENFKGFIPLAKKIKSTYFKSNKGVELGDSKEKVLNLYGKPNTILSSNGLDEYSWEFIGDLLYDGKSNLNGKPLAKDNFGHKATMYFKENKLVALSLYNDIP
jgi:hypothetical protein